EFELRPVLVRGGRTTQHWAVDLRQGDRVLATASFVFARRAETWEHQPARMPDVPPAESIEPLDTTKWMAWLSNYQFRFAAGAPVLSRSIHDPLHSQRSVLWVNDRVPRRLDWLDRKSTRLNSSHVKISYAVFCLKKKRQQHKH